VRGDPGAVSEANGGKNGRSDRPRRQSRHGLKSASQAKPTLQLTAKDFKSDQEVRWCPGCGDYAILAAMQQFMPELGVPRERIVFVSGIGCAARFPYYMQTYGMHSIHGRAPAIATGLSSSRPDLSVWVVTGDGDALSIGGNHLIHALRRNVNLKVLLFNNQIYGLTKGQYSPTSPLGTHNKTTPFGSLDYPFNPVSLALGAEATFVARSIDTDKAHLTGVLRRAAEHKGSVFVEIYQNCNVYNDGAFDAVRADKANRILLEHGQPIRFSGEGETLEQGVVTRPGGGVEIVDVDSVGEDALLRHDESAEDPSLAFALSRLSHTPVGPTPIGIFRAVERPVYDELMAEQIEVTRRELGEGDLTKLLHTGDTWRIGD
jgi:2-oxoglutarate/2-oxoacid ferredoxin oxidoreductase subunit beta